MKKEEFIKRRGEAAYVKALQRSRDWKAHHRDGCNACHKKWLAANPDKVLARKQEQHCKGGKYYEKHLEYQHTGIQGERNCIRWEHNYQYHDSKQATPNTEFHHEWIPGTSKYRGVALVDKEAHRHGIIKVILVLEG